VCSQQAGIPSGLQKTSLNDAPQIASLNTLGVWLRLSLTRNAGRRVKLLSRRSLPRKFTVKRRKEWPRKLLVSKKTITTDLPITSFFESLNG
jgi:hypothetical protein